jgi:hypothetical protein
MIKNKKIFLLLAISFFLIIFVYFYSIPRILAESIPPTSDEFVGPFSSWTNVQTAYGATGNGTTDDTDTVTFSVDRIVHFG